MENLDIIAPKELNDLAEAEAKKLAGYIKTHQLRNFFAAVSSMRSAYRQKKKYDDDIEMKLIMLKPKLAYAAGRQSKMRTSFYPFMKGAIDAVENSTNKDIAIKNFFALMESVIAYHKFHEN